MFAGFSINDAGLSLAVQQLTPWFIIMLAAGIVFMAPVQKQTEKLAALLEEGSEDAGKTKRKQSVFVWKVRAARIAVAAICILLLIWCMIRLSTGTYNPFIYFRF